MKGTWKQGCQMRNRSIMDWLTGVCLILGTLVAFVGHPAAAERVMPEDRTLYADVAGKVVDDVTGAPLAGVMVSLLYESVVTGSDGTFVFQKIPMIHSAQVSLRVSTDEGLVIGCTTFDVPVRYYPISSTLGDKVDIKIIEPGVDKTVELRLKEVTMSKVGKFCQECHMANPCVETSTFSSVVKTSKDMRGIIVKESQLPKYREQLKQKGVAKDSYMKIRYQDTHPDGMDMVDNASDTGPTPGLFNVPPDLKLHVVQTKTETMKFIVCDTCHSRHEPTDQKQFVLMSFDEDSKLCYQCHK